MTASGPGFGLLHGFRFPIDTSQILAHDAAEPTSTGLILIATLRQASTVEPSVSIPDMQMRAEAETQDGSGVGSFFDG